MQLKFSKFKYVLSHYFFILCEDEFKKRFQKFNLKIEFSPTPHPLFFENLTFINYLR